MEAPPQGDFARLQNPAQGLYTAEGGFFVLGERDCFKFPIERWMGAVLALAALRARALAIAARGRQRREGRREPRL